VVHRSFLLGASLIAVVSLALACSDDDESSIDPSETADAATADAGEAPAPPGINEGGTDPLAPFSAELALPIVFVHGFAGSAQQFQSQAMRFVANGYPAERLRAYEHDGAGFDIAGYGTGLDAVIEEVRATFKTDKVYLIGHSRGTSVSSMYLSDAARAAKVAKYVSLDGAGCSGVTIPCVSPAQTTNTRPGQTNPIPGQKHVEVATSKEAFAIQFEFLFGKAPEIIDIVKQRQPVVISGRAVNFPANTGRDGTNLEIWTIAADSGLRVGSKPLASFTLGAEGKWGPATVDPEAHYELVLSTSDSPTRQHFYSQPFLRSSEFVRLLSGPPDAPSRLNTNAGDGHAALIVLRMREFTPEDVLEVSTASKAGDQPARNVISDATGADNISIYLQDDAATPAQTTLALLPYFPDQPFQTGVDLFMPASDTPNGTITLKNLPRGDAGKPQTLNVPNWASTNHTVMVVFNDYPQD